MYPAVLLLIDKHLRLLLKDFSVNIKHMFFIDAFHSHTGRVIADIVSLVILLPLLQLAMELTPSVKAAQCAPGITAA